ncbi:aquaporin-like protein [Gorgonomyces haynaldii]|nr:aquaporin-like protein [Gorgonomyces haynaldii]
MSSPRQFENQPIAEQGPKPRRQGRHGSHDPHNEDVSEYANFTVDPDDFAAGIAEFIGTWFYTFIGLVAIQSAVTNGFTSPNTPLTPASTLLISIGFGFAWVICVGMAAPMSGGHINPAITIGVYCTGRMPPIRALIYIAFQITGACVGAALAEVVTPGGFLGYNEVNPNLNVGFTVLAEILFTFILVATYLSTEFDSEMDLGFTPLFTGLSILVGYLGLVPIDGGSMNPARSFGASAVAKNWEAHWIYWVGPIVGAILAVLLRNGFAKTAKRTRSSTRTSAW